MRSSTPREFISSTSQLASKASEEASPKLWLCDGGDEREDFLAGFSDVGAGTIPCSTLQPGHHYAMSTAQKMFEQDKNILTLAKGNEAVKINTRACSGPE